MNVKVYENNIILCVYAILIVAFCINFINIVYNLYEQICIAALDMEEIELAEDYLVKLTKKFKSSQRVSRLQGMCLEAREQFTEALAVYDEVLKENPANSLVRKRKVAVYRAQGKNEDAVNELHSILRLFPADVPSWIELAELHASLGEYSAAAHCYEEIVLIDPRNPHAHTRLADYYVQTKDLENLVLARKHYATSLESLSPKFNSHALTGLINCCKMILGQPSAVSAAERLVTEEMLKWAQEQ